MDVIFALVSFIIALILGDVRWAYASGIFSIAASICYLGRNKKMNQSRIQNEPDRRNQ